MSDISDKRRELCARVKSAGADGIRGEQLVSELDLSDTRELRRLLENRRIDGLHNVVGLPGKGYYWGPANRGAAKKACSLAKDFGRDWFYLAGIYGELSVEMNLAQMLLEFTADATQRAAMGLEPAKDDDGLAAMAAAGELDVGGILAAMLDFMEKHKDIYAKEIEQIGIKAAVMVDRNKLDRIRGKAAELLKSVVEMAGNSEK